MSKHVDSVAKSSRKLVRAAEAMQAAAAGGHSVLPVLKALCPHVHRQVVEDGGQPARLACWGRSVNIDENTREIIVHPAILQAIGSLAGVPMNGRSMHAGLAHTYAYLFSLVATPYGPKRDRWITTDLESGFGVEASTWSDRPKAGTLLGNLTYFLSRVLAADLPRSPRRFAELARGVAAELVVYDYARLSRQRIVEHVVLGSKRSREVFVYTDLLALPQRADCFLLIYSVQTGRRAAARFVTAFPVNAETARKLIAAVPSKGKGPVRLRYNAYVSGLFGRTIPGRSDLATPRPQS